MLLGSRGLQGLGAALASPTALALITTTFPAGPPRNRAFSVYAAMSGVGAAVGLLLGGWLTGLNPEIFGVSVDGWRLTFLINVPIGIIAALLAPRLLGESESHPGELDLPGAVTGTAGLVAIVFGLSRAGNQAYGWGDTWTITSLVAGVLLLALFVVVERRVEHPLLPFRILLHRTRATAFVTMMIVPAAMFAMFYFLSLYVQNVMGYSPIEAGVAFLPFCFGMVIAATVGSKLMSLVDPRFIAGTGTILAGFSLFMFSRLSVDDSAANLAHTASSGTAYLGDTVNYWTDLFPFIFTMSVGMGLTFVPMTLAAVHGVGKRDSGIGSGVLNTMQQVGGALGLATLATVAVHFSQDKAQSIVSSFQAAGGSCADRRGGQGRAERGRSGRVRQRRHARLHRRRLHDVGRLGDRLELPQRQARGARHRRAPRRGRRRLRPARSGRRFHPVDRVKPNVGGLRTSPLRRSVLPIKLSGMSDGPISQPTRASLIASTKAGRSSGLRLVIRLPSTTTSSSIQVAPAFSRSIARLG